MVDLTKGPTFSKLWQMTLPMAWGILTIVTFNLVDAYFVGQLGGQQLAALSFTFPVVMVFSSIALGLGTGAASVISRSIGAGEHQKTQNLTVDSLALATVCVFIFVLLGISSIRPLFTLLGASQELLPFVEDYMQIWYVGMIFVVIPMVGNSAIRATGDTRSPALIMTIAAASNAVLDPILIFGWGGLPALGIKGAALASVIGRIGTLIFALWVLKKRYGMLQWNPRPFAEVLQSWKEIASIAIPAGGANMLNPLAQTFITALLARFGSEAVAAYGVGTRIEAFFMILLFGLSSSFGPFVGQNFGAKNIARIFQGTRQSVLFCCFWSVFSFLIVLLLGQWFVNAFTESRPVRQLAFSYLLVVSFSLGADGIRLLGNAGLNAVGRPFQSTTLLLLKLLACYLPLSWFLAQTHGAIGIFWATAVANLFGGIVSLWFLKNIFPAARAFEKPVSP